MSLLKLLKEQYKWIMLRKFSQYIGKSWADCGHAVFMISTQILLFLKQYKVFLYPDKNRDVFNRNVEE